MLRKIISLQNGLINEARPGNHPGEPLHHVQINLFPATKQPTPRPLISANFENIAQPLNNGVRAANLLGRNIISAGDRLRDLVIPDALAAAVWMGGAPKPVSGIGPSDNVETMRVELENILASSCPLCESVIAGLDRPFVKEGEVDTTWEL